MPAIVVWLVGLLGPVLAHVLGRLVVALGVTAVTVVGVGTGAAQLKAEFVAAYSGLPATLLEVLGLLRVDQAMLVIFSAIVGRVALRMASDAVTSLTFRAPPPGRL